MSKLIIPSSSREEIVEQSPVDSTTKFVLTPENKKRMNRPIPTTNERGDVLPPLCIEVMPPRFAARYLGARDKITALGGSINFWLPEDMNPRDGSQPVMQILALPEDKIGIQDRFLNVEVGDLCLVGGNAFLVPTNWNDMKVYLIDPNGIVAFLIEDHYRLEETENT